MGGELEEVLKERFPGEDVKVIARVLAFAADRGSIRYEEIGLEGDLKVDLLFLLVKERLLLPVWTSRTLAWEDRILTFKSGERYEMPHVIRNLVRNAEKKGRWSSDYAIKKYLKDIGEPESDKILEFFKLIRKNAGGGKVTPDLIEEASEKTGLKSNIGRVIAELKGGGIISPCLRDPLHLQYEINSSLNDKKSFQS